MTSESGALIAAGHPTHHRVFGFPYDMVPVIVSGTRLTAWASLLACVIALACACGQSSLSAGSTPTPDGAAHAYVSLAQSYYDQYVTARGDGYDACVAELIAPECHDRGVAMIAVWESFLKDIASLPASRTFAGDVKIIGNHLPKAIADLKAMVAAAAAGGKMPMLNAANQYISDMVPTVTSALGDMYAPWRTE